MASKKKLGRGLNEIFGDDIDKFLDDVSNGDSSVKGSGQKLPIKQIRANPYQPRKEFDDAGLKELADSIKENGVFQPILVRKSISGYELVAGERRLRASKLAGQKDIPAIIVDFNDTQMMEISLLENIQRKDLTAMEKAEAYDSLIKKLGYTQEELAKRVSKSRSEITNMLRLLKLPKEVQELVNKGKLSYGQARTLLSLDDENKMIELAEEAMNDNLSVREMEKIVKASGKKKPKPVKLKLTNPYLEDVRNQLQRQLSTKVDITNKSITIRYNDVDDLNRILEILGTIEE